MCRCLMKTVLFIVNLLLTLAGIVIVGLGVLVIVQFGEIFNELLKLIPVNLNFIPWVVIVIGSIIFIIGFCGCYGSITESTCLLTIYAIFMGVLAAVKIIILVALFISVDDLKGSVDSVMGELFVHPNLNVTFHAIEGLLSCCGTTGPNAYNYTYDGQSYVPATCCTNGVIEEYKICPIENAFQIGCIPRVNNFIDEISTNSRTTLYIIIGAELLAMGFALYIGCTK